MLSVYLVQFILALLQGSPFVPVALYVTLEKEEATPDSLGSSCELMFILLLMPGKLLLRHELSLRFALVGYILFWEKYDTNSADATLISFFCTESRDCLLMLGIAINTKTNTSTVRIIVTAETIIPAIASTLPSSCRFLIC